MVRFRPLRLAVAGAAATAFLPGLAGAAVTGRATPLSQPGAWSVRTVHAAPRVRVGGRAFTPSDPDDLVVFGGHLFVAYQNGIGPQGQAAPDGVVDSTVIEYSTGGRILDWWSLRGKVDGLGADIPAGAVVATVNEDANTSLYTVDPSAWRRAQVVHWSYRPGNPLPHDGGTDAVTGIGGRLLISASAPGTVASPTHAPALYVGIPGPHRTVALRTVFTDTSRATVANVAPPTETPVSPPTPAWGTVPAEGTRVTLALTDPDSNGVVPAGAGRFAGSFLLDSQGDQQLVFVDHLGRADQSLSVLDLSQSVDDSAWIPADGGTVWATDPATDSVLALRGALHAGEVLVAATPGDADAPVPSPVADYLGVLDPWTGTVTAVPALAGIVPAGLVYTAG